MLRGIFQDLTAEVCSGMSHRTECSIRGPRITTQYIHSTVCIYFHRIRLSWDIQEYFCKGTMEAEITMVS